jgi:hypothetical protein
MSHLSRFDSLMNLAEMIFDRKRVDQIDDYMWPTHGVNLLWNVDGDQWTLSASTILSLTPEQIKELEEFVNMTGKSIGVSISTSSVASPVIELFDGPPFITVIDPNLPQGTIKVTAEIESTCTYANQLCPLGDFTPPKSPRWTNGDRINQVLRDEWKKEIEAATRSVKRSLREWPTCKYDGEISLFHDTKGRAVWSCSVCTNTNDLT